MDNFITLAKQGYQAYSDSQDDVKKTGGHEYNDPHHGSKGVPIDNRAAAQIADDKSASSGSNDLFAQALSFLATNNEPKTPIDEEHVTKAHKAAYEEHKTSSLDANSIGSAAAMQVLKSYISKPTSSAESEQEKSSDFQTKLIGQAMAEAAKLFDKSGGAASGDKQDAVSSAAMTMLKLFIQSKFGGGSSTTVGKDASSLGQAMSMASAFLNK